MAERTGGTPPHRLDDCILVCSAEVDEGFGVDPKYRRERVRAEPGVLTDTAIVEHSQFLPSVRVTVVCHPIRRFRTRETDAGMRSVAERLGRRTTTAAQRHPRTRLQALVLGVHQVLDVGH